MDKTQLNYRLSPTKIYMFWHCLVVAVIIIAPALFNRYPLIYSDTGNYIDRAFTLIPSYDRPVGYSLFIRVVTWLSSMWPVVIAQGVIGSWLTFRLFNYFFNDSRKACAYHLLTIITISSVTSLGWYASQLMPDIFTSYMILSLFLFVFDNERKINVFLYALIIFIALIVHFSNLAILLMLMALLGISTLLGREFIRKGQVLTLLVIALLSHQSVSVYNYIHHDSYKYSLSSNVFLMGRMSETGILKSFLNENCTNGDEFGLCAHRDNLPTTAAEFIWNYSSPFWEYHGDWDAADRDYAIIVRQIVLSPSYWGVLIWESAKATFKQMFQLTLGSGLSHYNVDSSPQQALKKRKQNEWNESIHSRQYYGELKLETVNMIDTALLFISICIFIVALFFYGLPERIINLSVVILIGIVSNAAVTGALANVYDRLQARVSWLLIILGVISLLVNLDQFKRSIRNSQ